MKKIKLMVYAFVCASLFTAYSDEPSKKSLSFGASLGLGTQIIGDSAYQSIGFMPDFSVGSFGIGLDLSINYQLYRWPGDKMGMYVKASDWFLDGDNDARPDSWTKDSFKMYVDLYLSKITYLRYGSKGSPLFIKLGSFDDASLGNGFIMSNYSNSLLRPEYKYAGLAFDLDGALFNFPFVGFESFTNSLSSFDLTGARLFVRPLGSLNIPIIHNLQLGTSFVYDSDPYIFYRRLDKTYLIKDPVEKQAQIEYREQELSKYEDTTVLVWGVDLRQPILHTDFLSLNLFSDLVFQGSAVGSMLGFGGSLAFFQYGAQVRFLGENFQPVYFDRSYDISRVQKLKTYLLNTSKYKDDNDLISTPALSGWFVSIGAHLLDNKISLFSSLDGPFGKVAEKYENSASVWPRLRSQVSLDGRRVFPLPIVLTAYYDKDFIKEWSDLASPENAIIGAQLAYQMGVARIQLTYNLKYLPEERRVSEKDPWEVSSKLETIISIK